MALKVKIIYNINKIEILKYISDIYKEKYQSQVKKMKKKAEMMNNMNKQCIILKIRIFAIKLLPYGDQQRAEF